MDNVETTNKGGAPLGNQNAAKGKRWSDAIDRALAKRCKGDGIKALDELAEKLLSKADEGDMSALKELGDRIEGKPQQQVALDARHSGTVVLQLTEADADL
jgi:hypothetical protein